MTTLKLISILMKAAMFFAVVTAIDMKKANVWGGPPKELIDKIVYRERWGLALLVLSSVIDIVVLFAEMPE